MNHVQGSMIVFADTDTAEGLGRAVNAPTTAKEFRDAGDEALIVFDGAGTKWAAELSDPEHEYHQLLEDAQELVEGACAYRSSAFGVREQIEQSPVPLLDEYDGHPSLRRLISDGYEVVTF